MGDVSGDRFAVCLYQFTPSSPRPPACVRCLARSLAATLQRLAPTRQAALLLSKSGRALDGTGRLPVDAAPPAALSVSQQRHTLGPGPHLPDAGLRGCWCRTAT